MIWPRLSRAAALRMIEFPVLKARRPSGQSAISEGGGWKPLVGSITQEGGTTRGQRFRFVFVLSITAGAAITSIVVVVVKLGDFVFLQYD